MNTGERRTRTPRTWQGRIAATTAIVLAGIGVFALPQAATAAAYTYPGAIDATSITLTPLDDPTDVHLWSDVRVDAGWSVPNGAVGGETFGLTLPVEFEGYTAPFSAMSPGPDPQVIATCAVTGADFREVVCTLTDYVNGKTDVNGTLWFRAEAKKQTDSTTVDFTVDGDVVTVDLPGEGGIIGDWAPAPEPFKDGWQHTDGTLRWQIVFPGADFATSDTVTIRDRLAPASATSSAHTFRTFLTVYTETNADGTPHYFDPSEYTVVVDDDQLGYTLTIPGPLDPDLQYTAVYSTTPVNPTQGAVYENSADLNGVALSGTVHWVASGGGDGNGDQPGAFDLSKLIDGSGSASVDPTSTFTVTYSYGDPAVTKQTVVSADGTVVSSEPIPAGSVVTLEEIAPSAAAGFTWGGATFSGTGVTDLGDGRATVTIHAGADIAVTLTNTAVTVPSVPTDEHPPTQPPVREAPLTGSLAQTGGSVSAFNMAMGIAALIAGLGLVVGARRRLSQR